MGDVGKQRNSKIAMATVSHSRQKTGNLQNVTIYILFQ